MANKNDIINELAKKFAGYTNNNNGCKHTNGYLEGMPINNDGSSLMKSIDRPNVTFDWDKESNDIMIHFGKNGLGLTDEFITIGKFIERLSKTAFVYITETFIDSVDDVYDIKLHYVYK